MVTELFSGESRGKPPEILVEYALKLKFLEGSATPLFIVKRKRCVRLGLLLLVKI